MTERGETMGKVGLKEAEYTLLKTEIAEAHGGIIQSVTNAVAQIQSLNQTGGGFYAKELTPKVNSVTEVLNDIRDTMESAFETHEEIIESFQTAIENYDTCC